MSRSGPQAAALPREVPLRWHVATLTEEFGFHRQTLFDMDFTADGVVWIGASDGLYRYDGYRCSHFTTTNGLPSNLVRAVKVARDGALWLGTDRGAGVFDGERFLRHGSEQGLAGSSVRRIVEDTDGSLWFCCDRWPNPQQAGGLSRFHQGQWQSFGTAEGLTNDYVVNYARTAQGIQVALTSSGMFVRTGARWETLPEWELPNKEPAWNLVDLPGGLMFVETSELAWIREAGRWRPCPDSPYPLCRTRDGQLISLGEDAGQKAISFTRWTGSAFELVSTPVGQPAGGLQSLKEAPDGAVWLLRQGAVVRWDRRNSPWRMYSHLPIPRMIDSRGVVWFARAGLTVAYAKDEFKVFPGLGAPLVEGRDGTIWGFSEQGVVCLQQERVTSFASATLGLARIRVAISDSQGNPWFCGTSAANQPTVAVFQEGRWQSHTLPNQGYIRSAAVDPAGGILCAVLRDETKVYALWHFDAAGAKPVALPARPPPLVDPSVAVGAQRLWLFAFDGLYWSEFAHTDKLRPVDSVRRSDFGPPAVNAREAAFPYGDDGDGSGGILLWDSQRWWTLRLNADAPLALHGNGDLFVAEGAGLHISRRENRALTDFLALPQELTIRSVVQGAQGEIWVGTTAGTLRFTPDAAAPQASMDLTDSYVRQDRFLRGTPMGLHRFVPRARAPSCRFSWSIDGGAWSAFAPWPTNGLPVHALTPGEHQLALRAMDAFGHVQATPTPCPFTVQRIPLQERPWFRPGAAALFLLQLGLLGAVWHSRRKLAGHASLLEHTVAQRTQELRRDIARREETEHQLRSSEQRFRGIFDSVFRFSGLLSPEGVAQEINRAALELMGTRPEDVCGRPIWQAAWWSRDPTAPERVKAAVQRAALGAPARFETTHADRAGATVHLEFNLDPVRDETGQVVLLALEGRDVTERKRGESAHRSLQEQLAQAQKMESVGRLAGGVAHDFNNLLTVVLGHADMVLADTSALPEPTRESLAEIRAAGQKASELTRQLLAFSRKQVLQARDLDLNVLIAGFGKMLARLIGEDIELQTTLDPKVGLVRADPSQLEQVLLNLAVNARDAMPQGGRFRIQTANVALDENYARAHPGVKPGFYVQVSVADTGHGMSEEVLRHIFEPFFTTKELGKGTGLGLATVYGVVQQHEGHIAVESAPGRGTTFRVYLPRQNAAEPAALPISPPPPPRGNETVLLVEDDVAVRKLTCQMLSRCGYQVLEAAQGEQALDVASRHRPIDLLVTDTIMPGISGPEVYRRVSTLQPRVKVLYCSGYTGSAIEHYGIRDGEIAFLQKPFSSADLARKVREVLDGDGAPLSRA